jgi:predicted 2-oxoglutarate/Fe(II)-dependent dioxygenase YbiX
MAKAKAEAKLEKAQGRVLQAEKQEEKKRNEEASLPRSVLSPHFYAQRLSSNIPPNSDGTHRLRTSENDVFWLALPIDCTREE